MKRIMVGRIWTWALVAVVGASSEVRAQTAGLRQNLMSPVDSIRIHALNRLVSESNANLPYTNFRERHARAAATVRGRDSIDVALIRLLERENEYFARGPRSTSEEYSEYYASLIAVVAQFQDPQALAGLVGAMGTGAIARDGVVALGEVAVPALLSLADSGGLSRKQSAIQGLGLIASSVRLTPENERVVRSQLMKGLRDRSEFIRMASITALDGFFADEVSAGIMALSKNDPYHVVEKGRSTYPVRELALKWLNRHQVK